MVGTNENSVKVPFVPFAAEVTVVLANAMAEIDRSNGKSGSMCHERPASRLSMRPFSSDDSNCSDETPAQPASTCCASHGSTAIAPMLAHVQLAMSAAYQCGTAVRALFERHTPPLVVPSSAASASTALPVAAAGSRKTNADTAPIAVAFGMPSVDHCAAMRKGPWCDQLKHAVAAAGAASVTAALDRSARTASAS
jgi:hypothetical protein